MLPVVSHGSVMLTDEQRLRESISRLLREIGLKF